MAFGSTTLHICPLGSVGEEGETSAKPPQTNWNTWFRMGKVLLLLWGKEVVGLIHCRRRSQASFMMPREHRGKPGKDPEVDSLCQVLILAHSTNKQVWLLPFRQLQTVTVFKEQDKKPHWRVWTLKHHQKQVYLSGTELLSHKTFRAVPDSDLFEEAQTLNTCCTYPFYSWDFPKSFWIGQTK